MMFVSVVVGCDFDVFDEWLGADGCYFSVFGFYNRGVAIRDWDDDAVLGQVASIVRSIDYGVFGVAFVAFGIVADYYDVRRSGY